MASSLEFVPFKEFVEGLPARTVAKSGDKSIVSNSTEGPGSETNAAQTQKVIADNVAPEFDETGETTYLAGTPVSRGGKTYVFKVDHSGAWNASNVVQIPSSEAVLKVCRSKIIQSSYIPSSLDDLKESFVYIVQRTTGLTTTGFPTDAPAEGIFKLSVVKSYSSASEYQVEQELKMVLDTSKIWRRVYNTIGSSWSAWTQSNFALSVEKNQIFASWNKNLSNLNNAPINSIIRLTVTSATTTLNIPSDFLKDSANNGELRTYKCYYSDSNYRIYQELTRDEDNAVWRRMFQSSWGAWTKIELGYISQAPVEIFHNLATNPSDLNNLTTTKIYVVQLTSSSSISNFPTNYPEGGIGVLSVYKAGISATTPNVNYQIVQRLEHFTSGKKWFRYYSTVSSAWGGWKEDTGLFVSENQIMASWNKNLSDLNNAPINSLLKLTVTSATTTQNIPSDFLVDSANDGELTTCKCYYSDSDYRIYQNLTRQSDGAVWYRAWLSNTGAWGPWHKRSVLENIVTIGSGKQYETLRAGITAAYDIPNCKVLVYPGVYDLAEECADILAETMTANFTPCPLGNGMHVIFFDGAYVKANIDQGELSDLDFHYVQEHFEPFGSRVGSYTIENLNLESKNSRYGVHDDYSSSVPCVRKFINCHMVRTAGNTAFRQNIGGGLSAHETVVIEGGTYKTIPSVGNPFLNGGDIDYCQQVISYHNGTSAECDCSITVKDVLFEDKGFLDILSHGASDIMSRVYISNCRFYYPPVVRYSYQDDHDNMEIRAAWNNEQIIQGEWVVNSSDKRYATFVPGN